jgi:hypothetical protein
MATAKKKIRAATSLGSTAEFDARRQRHAATP